MLKRDYPIYFDTDVVPIRHKRWDITYDNISVTNQTESGTDDVEVTRFGKATIDAQFDVTERWAKFFRQYSIKQYFTVKYYDVLNNDYVERVVRMENISVSEYPESVTIDGVNGIYQVSFVLYEF